VSFATDLALGLRRRLLPRFGERLELVRLFGSYARGDAHEESDVDVLVLVRGLTRPEKIAVIEAAGELGLAAGRSVSALAMDAEEFQKLRTLEARLALDIDREGVSV
jgi:predicted nucleotidyltransferase